VPGEAASADPNGATKRVPRYYVFEILATTTDTVTGEPVPTHVAVLDTGMPFMELLNAWHVAGSLGECYPGRCFVAGDLGSTSYWAIGSLKKMI
jgi:hypothetical protein